MRVGANQAFEDGWSLALVMASEQVSKVWRDGGEDWLKVLEKWEGKRKERVGRLLRETMRMNNARAPKEVREKLPKEEVWNGDGGVEEGRWIFEPKIEEWVREIVQ
jgi:2-polyprenyl-6-methoxyphenol hydroxylase-like FAD-dependent oxidoreductase